MESTERNWCTQTAQKNGFISISHSVLSPNRDKYWLHIKCPFGSKRRLFSSSLIFTNNKVYVEWMHDEQISNSPVPRGTAVYPQNVDLHFKSFGNFNELQGRYRHCLSGKVIWQDMKSCRLSMLRNVPEFSIRPARAYKQTLTDVVPYIGAAGLRHFTNCILRVF